MQERLLFKHHRAKQMKRVVIPVAFLVIVLSSIGSGVLIYQNFQDTAKQEDTATFEQENKRSFSLGETLVLNFDEDEKGMEHGGYVAGFMWSGTLEYSIKEAKVYASYQESGLPPEKQLDKLEDDDRLVLLKVELYNRDAVNLLADESDDLYNIGLFSNLITTETSFASFGQIVYFDGVPSDLDSKRKAHSFRLGQGERKTFTVALKAPAFAVNEKTLIGVGVSNLGKYTINLELAKEEA